MSSFSIEGIQDHIGIRVVKGNEREQIIERTKIPVLEISPASQIPDSVQTAFPFGYKSQPDLGKGSEVENRSGNRSRSDSPLSNEKSFFCGVPLRKGESKRRVYSHHTHGARFLRTYF